MATYPNNIASFYAVQNGIDTVQASHVNTAYDEITATQAELGESVSARSGAWAATPAVVSSLTFSDLRARIDNVENGAYYAQTYLVNNTGGTTINPSGDAVKGLIVKARASQTANLMEFQLNNGTVVSYVKNDGTFFTPIIDGGTA